MDVNVEPGRGCERAGMRSELKPIRREMIEIGLEKISNRMHEARRGEAR